MNSDIDIKIAGDKPSKDIKKNIENVTLQNNPDKASIKKAKDWGREVALEFIGDAETAAMGKGDNEMLLQRRMLLSFTATVGFEQLCHNDTLSGIAQKSFLDTIRIQALTFSAHLRIQARFRSITLLSGAEVRLTAVSVRPLLCSAHTTATRFTKNSAKRCTVGFCL